MTENKRYETQVINDEILEKLSLKNRYNFVRDNLRTILSDQQFRFLTKAQDFCLDYENKNKITHGPNEDIYDWVPDFGKEGYITRQTPYECIDLNYEDYGMAI
ncbi:MAG: hypothetical protein ACFFFB_06520, partial [Candidatus Heimdallarchaeota archaeon]